MFLRTYPIKDFWRVNSYGYPCYFNDSQKSQEAWETLLSFYNFSKYDKLKDYWASGDSPRFLSAHAVESWKATFEEMGLLYVVTRSNLITITPAGMQLREAADHNNQDEFAWIGLNLLLRYPLRGPRRPKSEAHGNSDLLLYRFLYSALLDLGGYIWWTEFERILCRVFKTGDAESAVIDILELRDDPELLSRTDLPVPNKSGGFYNSLNQVMVHAGMNHLLLRADNSESPYGITEPKRKELINRHWVGMIRQTLFLDQRGDQCSNRGMAVLRLPIAPDFKDEISYFEYLGASIKLMDYAVATPLRSMEMYGDRVFLLDGGTHYRTESEKTIIGNVNELCQIARGQRLILSHDERWTYLVEDKELLDTTTVKVTVRQARPLKIAALKTLLGGDNV